MLKKTIIAIGSAGALIAVLSFSGCGDNGGGTDDMGGGNNPDMTMAGGGDMTMAPDCVTNPMTPVDILNGCTTAQSVDIMPFYPPGAPGGVLPTIPGN